MYEEVCLLCGRPVVVDGRAYCSDECESLDATSPSISTTSSAQPSPYLRSTVNGPINLADVPALVSSTLGHSLNGYASKKSHRYRLSISSSSTSSVGYSALTDDEEDAINPALYCDDDDADIRGVAGSTKSNGSFGHLLHLQPPAGLNYARRPSTTNTRSTIPSLHRRASSNSTEDDVSDAPSAPLSTSSSRSKSRATRSRNRASLPAYFSLLALTSSTSPNAQRSPASLKTLSSLSRSLKSSPTTPVISGPSSVTLGQLSRVSGVDGTPRGRGRRRDPEARSTSCRKSTSRSPPRGVHTLTHAPTHTHAAPPPCRHHTYAHIGPQTRARLDSVEKVFEWVSSSPVVTIGSNATRARGRTLTRRNSSPPAKPDARMLFEDAGFGLGQSLQCAKSISLDDEEEMAEERERRGRRLPHELDEEPRGPGRQDAPGFGNGRSGLRAREERGRGRVFR